VGQLHPPNDDSNRSATLQNPQLTRYWAPRGPGVILACSFPRASRLNTERIHYQSASTHSCCSIPSRPVRLLFVAPIAAAVEGEDRIPSCRWFSKHHLDESEARSGPPTPFHSSKLPPTEKGTISSSPPDGDRPFETRCISVRRIK